MDYKYIENLVERYFDCKTTLIEEQILRSFFMQYELPENLVQYKPLFETLNQESHLELPDDFDNKVMAEISNLELQQKTSPFTRKLSNINLTLKPFYKAVASVALIITVGLSASEYFNSKEGDTVEYNYAKYHDTYSDPQVAYSQVSSALNDLSKAFKSNNIGVTDTATISEAAAGKQLQ
ncbi:MAG: hypothetical protein SOW56_06535 [Bacteroidaceae bacterium]|nr:hypothetical protein [Bacteroidaceae bacterium]